jgi:two-component system, OmpR family, KDP operon response regulator KdpE
MSSRASVLVIDDEAQIRRLLELTLEAHGFKVFQAASGEEGMLRTAMDRPELIILDLGLPDAEGIDILRKIRETSATPIVILSVRASEQEIIGCLEAGADDYLIKPFRTGELVARVRAALRHRHDEPLERIFTVDDIVVDLDGRTVKRHGESVKLTATEYALLALFVRNAGKVLTHRYILEQVWGPSYAEETHYSRIYVAQLRKKLEVDPSNPTVILTESGIGYRLAIE